MLCYNALAVQSYGIYLSCYSILFAYNFTIFALVEN